ncbi:hypothetical protein EBE87_26935 [Pseudoroseomonas wenyumeiae]|uniref:Uncharacterized protein n=1 Tax=Teichococcus wenyumeiae TaxID=2478470 RepID=A0A3A9J6Z3_9PROT|nr:hypothetical protein D6Z83_23620 [Pseudoroseomonas wenyumeiae]RMI15171.1 hypothetical protein EBE87_26935 [Pseudoroseomonas wenyumeiae]
MSSETSLRKARGRWLGCRCCQTALTRITSQERPARRRPLSGEGVRDPADARLRVAPYAPGSYRTCRLGCHHVMAEPGQPRGVAATAGADIQHGGGAAGQ